MRAGTVLLLLLVACGPTEGPELPTNVGATHRATSGSARARERAEAQAEAETAAPVRAVGDRVWADRRSTGFFFHGTVVEIREDAEAQHRVVYDTGEGAWVTTADLRPHRLPAEVTLQVQTRHGGPFTTATLLQRAGPALFVRYANGLEGWATLSHVRLAEDGEALPRATAEAEAEAETPATVWVDYRLQGLLFPATVTAERDDGARHVVYRDGVTEWARAGQIFPDPVTEGMRVHVRRRLEPADWVRGRVEERRGEALRVTYDDGGAAWTSLYRTRVALIDMPTPDPSPRPSDEELDEEG